MVNLVTFIGRVTDSMILVATMESSPQLTEYISKAKQILKNLNSSSPSRCTIQAGQYLYHYIIENNVCYLCLAEKTYNKRLAFQYLEELQLAFENAHGADVPRYSRPYAAVNFDPKMSRIRKEYMNPNSAKNVQKLSQDLHEIKNIMVDNIQEVLKRGEKLDDIQNKSSSLLQGSSKFQKQSKYINWLYMWRTRGPVVAIILIMCLVLYWKVF